MKLLLFVLNLIAFLAVAIWFVVEPGWESGSSTIVALVTFISHFFWNDSIKKKKHNATQKNISKTQIRSMQQTAGENSTQYQSGGNITVNNK